MLPSALFLLSQGISYSFLFAAAGLRNPRLLLRTTAVVFLLWGALLYAPIGAALSPLAHLEIVDAILLVGAVVGAVGCMGQGARRPASRGPARWLPIRDPWMNCLTSRILMSITRSGRSVAWGVLAIIASEILLARHAGFMAAVGGFALVPALCYSMHICIWSRWRGIANELIIFGDSQPAIVWKTSVVCAILAAMALLVPALYTGTVGTVCLGVVVAFLIGPLAAALSGFLPSGLMAQGGMLGIALKMRA